ncbi:hypothetical protein L5G28_16995 [Gordonia sp. HY285]|uniref:hypothetical protein n=1 Tax=Gordonia liuliyuniae TaxID=2911517 RepID=UPI001F409536|nr:hypothetical protein [Gordonia liuliyuniae]MCF8611845.1 hypothetical protein [Gordonia liuliyuniae]
MSKLTDHTRQTLDVIAAHSDALRAIDTDDNVSESWREKLRVDALDAHRRELDDARTRARSIHSDQTWAAHGLRPQLDADSPAALIRSEQAWNNVVRPLLDTGVSLSEALAGAGVDAALGAERFAAVHVAITLPDRSIDTARSIVAESVGAAFVAAEADPAKAAVLQDALDADAQLATFDYAVDRAEAGDTLAAALAAHAPTDGTDAPE